MTEPARVMAVVAAVGLALLAGAWLTDIATAQHQQPEAALDQWLMYLVGLAYWTYTLPASVILSAAMTRLAFRGYPAYVFPPPVTHFYPDYAAHQFAASVVATVASIALYAGLSVLLRPFLRRHPRIGRRGAWSLVAGYCGTAILLPLVRYESSPFIDTLRFITQPLAYGFRWFGRSYPFIPGFAGSTLPQFTRLSAVHVVVLSAGTFLVATLIKAVRRRGIRERPALQ